MPIKCYNKPNRSKNREFTACDVARLADKARVGEGVSGGTIVSTVGVRMGYPVLIDGTLLVETDQLKQQIETLIANAELIEDITLAIPVGGLFVRLILRFITSFSGAFATIISIVISALLKGKQLPRPITCNRR